MGVWGIRNKKGAGEAVAGLKSLIRGGRMGRNPTGNLKSRATYRAELQNADLRQRANVVDGFAGLEGVKKA